MNENPPTNALKASMGKRVLNEFVSKILNEERLDHVVKSRQDGRGVRISEHAEMAFYCECDDQCCSETIQISTEEYERLHSKTKYFIVIPSHVRLDLEEIITTFTKYTLVGKFFPWPGPILQSPDKKS